MQIGRRADRSCGASRCRPAVVAGMLGGALPAARAAGSEYASPLNVVGVLQVTLGLGVVLVAIFLSAWFLRRAFRGYAGVNRHLRVVSGMSMGAREKLVLVQVGPKQILLGVAPGRIQTLHVLDEPLPASSDREEGPSFAGQLAGVFKAARGRAHEGGGRARGENGGAR